MEATKWIGVDIHKSQFTVCIMRKDKSKEYRVYERTSEKIKNIFK